MSSHASNSTDAETFQQTLWRDTLIAHLQRSVSNNDAIRYADNAVMAYNAQFHLNPGGKMQKATKDSTQPPEK